MRVEVMIVLSVGHSAAPVAHSLGALGRVGVDGRASVDPRAGCGVGPELLRGENLVRGRTQPAIKAGWVLDG
ncbi:MAG: hypothetical protein JOY71_31260 [Acetobacteraceae bacterium]|nr:hypothetical protein [Acetobacteraceae bacterium]